MSIEIIFLSLFAVTFLVAVVAFGAYGYLLVLLMRNHSEKFNPETTAEYVVFLWQLMLFYIYRAMSGFFGIEGVKELKIVKEYGGQIKRAESKQEKLIKVYRLFSSAYILFFILLICLMVVFLYMILGPYL